jgi:aminopeptidase 2
MATERVLLPSSLTPSHYSLTLTPDLEKLTFAGNVDINVTVHVDNVCEVTLHSKEIQVSSVTFKSTSSPEAALSLVGINYNFKLTTVTFVFDGAFPVGSGVLSIEYTGILNGDMAGFYKVTRN